VTNKIPMKNILQIMIIGYLDSIEDSSAKHKNSKELKLNDAT
jgi:hypothetical protein